MGKVMNVWGKMHKSFADPADAMKDEHVDPANIFKYGENKAAAAPETPLAMPDVDSEAVASARRRKVAAMKNRGGRASTIITGGEDRLGG